LAHGERREFSLLRKKFLCDPPRSTREDFRMPQRFQGFIDLYIFYQFLNSRDVSLRRHDGNTLFKVLLTINGTLATSPRRWERSPKDVSLRRHDGNKPLATKPQSRCAGARSLEFYQLYF